MVEITKCPPGVAKGAYDLQNWAHRRAKGQSGVPNKKTKRKSPSKRKKSAKWHAWQSRRQKKNSFCPATTPRTDFSDMNVYDQSIPPWDENQVILETP